MCVCVCVFMVCVFAGACSEKQKERLKMNTLPECNYIWSGKSTGTNMEDEGGSAFIAMV